MLRPLIVARRFRLHSVLIIAVLSSVALRPPCAHGDAFDEYAPSGQFGLPLGTDVFDVLNDGRIIALVDANVFVETGVATRVFEQSGTLPDDPGITYPAFIAVSPDGTRIAVGDNGLPGSIGVFEITTLTGSWFAASHFLAQWYDDTLLGVSGADGNSVTLLDTTSPNPLDPDNPVIVDNTGIPAGIAFDLEGNLYTGNGFGDGLIETGEIRAFDHASWTAVAGGADPLDFLADGTLVVDILSADSLGFDDEGNLHVGGGDFLGGTDLDFIALVHAPAISDALLGLGPADPEDPSDVRKLDPDTSADDNFYSINSNPVTGELYVRSYGATTVFIYAAPPAIPAVSHWGALVMALLLLTTATILLRSPYRGRRTPPPHTALLGGKTFATRGACV